MPSSRLRKVWPVLIVDDDQDVLSLSELVFEGMIVEGGQVCLDYARTLEEALWKIENKVYAVVVVDLVLGRESRAGFRVIRRLRQLPLQQATQVVIRTGYSDTFPLEESMRDYFIHDYWSKTDITSSRMKASMAGLLRSHATQVHLLWERAMFNRSYDLLIRDSIPSTMDEWDDALDSLCQLAEESNSQAIPFALQLVEKKKQSSGWQGDDALIHKWLYFSYRWPEPISTSFLHYQWNQRALNKLHETAKQRGLLLFERTVTDLKECEHLYLIVWFKERPQGELRFLTKRFLEDLLTLYHARLKAEEQWGHPTSS
jgi:CheY-like chemotaxis protein